MEGLEKERDFYFGKLRDIEIICQEDEGSDTNKRIMDILYATEVSMRTQKWFIFFSMLLENSLRLCSMFYPK